MLLDLSKPGKVPVDIKAYCIDKILLALSEDYRGIAVTSTGEHVFNINLNQTKLKEDKVREFHHVVAQLLFLWKRGWPNIRMAISFLTTRVKQPDENNQQKLIWTIKY